MVVAFNAVVVIRYGWLLLPPAAGVVMVVVGFAQACVVVHAVVVCGVCVCRCWSMWLFL